MAIPDPLSLTGEAFAAAWRGAGLAGGRLGALEHYAQAYRTGAIAARVAPVVRTHLSASPEGEVLKFCQRVPRHLPAAGSGAGSTSDSAQVFARSLLPQPDTLEAESVLIPMVGKKRSRSYTLCVSSQIGCAMNCGFCQTAQMGLLRSLSPAEIVGQWVAAQHVVERPDASAPIRNIVFMGMGEPLDNLDNVLQALAILTDQRGPAMPASRITISTVGHVANLARLAERVRTPGWHRLSLAVSLNAPTDAIRSTIMPINRAWPLASLRGALEAWPRYAGTHICLEYVLIPGVNDTPACAAALASFVLGCEMPGAEGDRGAGEPVPRYSGARLTAMVNVIPYNPRHHSPWPAPSEEQAEEFMTWVNAFGVFVKRRRTKGRDTMAACGQLGNPELRRR